jgi:hypothetical protein
MKNRIISLILALALIASVIPAIVVSADDAATPTLEIVSKNLSYESNIRLLFAVKSANVGDAEIKLNVYEEDPAANADAAIKETVPVAYTESIGSYGECDVFFTTGIAAKFLQKQLYVQAVVTVDGTTYKSEVERYSIVEYCHEMIAKDSTDAAKDAKYMNVIEYGAAIQSFLADDKNADGTPKYSGAYATDYKYVTIKGGTLDGRYDTGIYLAGEKVKPYGEGVSLWSDGKTNDIANGAEYTVSESVDLTSVDTKLLATENFESATSNSLPSNISFVTTLPKIGNLGNSYTQSAYVVGKFTNNETNTTNCLFTSNKYQASRAIIQITESVAAEQNATMVEFEADLCLDWSTNGDNCEFFNIVLADKDGNAAYNLVLRNYINGNRLILLNRDSSGAMGPKTTQTLFHNADNVWFNLRVTYKYVSASEIAVEIFLNGNSVRTETVPATADAAITLENLVNVYVVINGNSGAHAINSYVAIDNVVFRKIAK